MNFNSLSLVQEAKLVAVQNGLKKMAAEAATKEKNLRTREQAVIDSENDLHVGQKQLFDHFYVYYYCVFLQIVSWIEKS